jgi:hypothetical protein
LSEITTCVALAAVTVRVEELPAATVPGEAVIVTEGEDVGEVELAAPLPQEVIADRKSSVTQRNRQPTQNL